MHTKKMKEVNDNSPLKTDDNDLRVIADIIRLGRALTIVVPEGDAAYLRRLNNARERHVGEQTALLNQLQQLDFLIFPEFKTVLKNMKGKTAQHIVKRSSTPERFSLGSGLLPTSPHWIQTALSPRIMEQAYHCYVSLEDGADGGSDCETCGGDPFEIIV
jgi:hypothetical protein